MTRCRVEIENPARKQLRAMRDVSLRDRIEREIMALGDDPRPAGVKKLAGYRDLWRIRVGDWRVVYRIGDGRLVVVIVTVAKRSEVCGRVGR